MDETERLNDLIGRLKKAEGPSRELDRLIEREVRHPKWREQVGKEEVSIGDGDLVRDSVAADYLPTVAPAYTASLDEAMRLVRGGDTWNLGKWFNGTGVVYWFDLHGPGQHQTRHPSAAIAVCITALRARLPHPAKDEPTPSEPGPKFDEPEMPELKMGVRHLGTTSDAARIQALTDAILAIDAKATPYGSGIVENGEEYVTRYIMPAGPLHRALGLIGRCAAKPAAPAAPTGYVPVKRELLEEVARALTFATLNRLSEQLRALLSPAQKDEAK